MHAMSRKTGILKLVISFTVIRSNGIINFCLISSTDNVSVTCEMTLN